MSETVSAAAGERAVTERLLAEAALRLVDRDGVLAGLNLREVAEEARVNRGLIYHYFGSRQALLRAATATAVQESDRHLKELRALPFATRRTAMFRALAEHPRFAQLQALLALDGDEEVRAFPRLDQTLAELDRDRAEGALHDGTDAVALHVITAAAIIGYAVMRSAFARDLHVDPEDLDERTATALEDLLSRLASPETDRG